jgi:hypothetical protein
MIDDSAELLKFLFGEELEPIERPTRPSAPKSNVKPRLVAPSPIPGFDRMLQTPNRDLQQIAQRILSTTYKKPFGTQTPFEYKGKKYLAVLEQHSDSRRGPHPGISLFIESGSLPTHSKAAPSSSAPSSSAPSSSAPSRDQRVLAGLMPELRGPAAQLVKLLASQGISIALVNGRRSMAEQEKLYQQGRTTEGAIVTQVKPGGSKHNYGAAVDVAVLGSNGKPSWPEDDELWTKIGEAGESLGLRWGGRWKGFRDRPHFELPISIQQLRGGVSKAASKKSDKKRLDLDVRPQNPLRKNYDYGEGLYFGKMDRYKSVKDFLEKSRKNRRKKRKKIMAAYLKSAATVIPFEVFQKKKQKQELAKSLEGKQDLTKLFERDLFEPTWTLVVYNPLQILASLTKDGEDKAYFHVKYVTKEESDDSELSHLIETPHIIFELSSSEEEMEPAIVRLRDFLVYVSTIRELIVQMNWKYGIDTVGADVE